jgi:hypothetical protein
MRLLRRKPPVVVRTQATSCRDLHGVPCELLIGLTRTGDITMTSPQGDLTVLTRRQVGGLRAVLRNAVIASMLNDTEPDPAGEPTSLDEDSDLHDGSGGRHARGFVTAS